MTENLIFFSIYFFIIAIVVLSCAVIIVSIFKSLQKLFRRIFNIEEREKRIDKDVTEEFKIIKEDYSKEIANMPKNQVIGNLGGPAQNPADIEAGEPASHDAAASDGEEKEQKDIVKEQRAKKEKDIAEGLGEFKKSSSEEKLSKLSGLPDREEKDEEVGIGEKIKIPRAKRFYEDEKTKQENVAQGKYFIKDINGLEKTGITTNHGVIPVDREQPGENKGSREIPSSGSEAKILSEKIKEVKHEDPSIFEGKSEISRLKLKNELRYNPKVWQAQRQAGLTLSPIERAKLEKEVFSQALGGNISKTDIKWGIEKLNQKMLSTKDLAEKGKLRKEINFFKKIGGV